MEGELWVARDQRGNIAIYRGRPTLSISSSGMIYTGTRLNYLHHDEYPNVTFENSPMKLVAACIEAEPVEENLSPKFNIHDIVDLPDGEVGRIFNINAIDGVYYYGVQSLGRFGLSHIEEGELKSCSLFKFKVGDKVWLYHVLPMVILRQELKNGEPRYKLENPKGEYCFEVGEDDLETREEPIKD